MTPDLGGQLRSLVAMRWRMVRDRRTRAGLLAVLLLIPGLSAVAVAAALAAPADYRSDVAVLLPSIYVGVITLAVLAPLTAGGGNELFPPEQLVAYPVRPSTHFFGAVLLAPLNLAWIVQVLVLVAASAYAGATTGMTGWTIATGLVFVWFATVVGHAIAWGVVGLRQSRPGRLVTLAAGVAIIAVAVVLERKDRLTDVLDESPTTSLVVSALQGPTPRWAITVASLLAASLVAFRVGVAACAWTLRRSGDLSSRLESAPVPRRRASRTRLGAMLAVDRASVWRSRPLRRGVFVLGAMPGLVAAASGLTWAQATLLPGLVCAGAGLLFGVNAFSLDGSGAVWLATLPHPPRIALLSKAWAVAEVCLAGTALALLGAGLRVGRLPTATEASCLVAAALTATLVVTTSCLRLSVRRPHRAELRHARDTPAPPATMAIYSAALAIRTTMLGLLFATLARLDDVSLPLLTLGVVALFALRSAVASVRTWDDPVARARVVSVVAHG